MNIINEKNGVEKYLMTAKPMYYSFETTVPFTVQRNIVIAGFPGVGKSYTEKVYTANCIDMESSIYHWEPGTIVKTTNMYWPGNYISAIFERAYKNRWAKTYILTSTHKEVLTGLKERGIDFIIVAPYDKYKALRRYQRRGSPKNFIDSIDKNWDTYMTDLESYGVHTIYTDMYLSNLICGGDR